MMKRHELSDTGSCFNKARDDEIIFVLLARDMAAPATIRAWCAERVRLGKNAWNDPKIKEALQCAENMEEQRDANPCQGLTGPEISGNDIADAIEAESKDWRVGLSAKPKYRQHEMYYEPPAMIVAVHESGFGSVFCKDGVLVLEGRFGVRFLAPAEEWVTA